MTPGIILPKIVRHVAVARWISKKRNLKLIDVESIIGMASQIDQENINTRTQYTITKEIVFTLIYWPFARFFGMKPNSHFER
jgi:hypothetical protein